MQLLLPGIRLYYIKIFVELLKQFGRYLLQS